MNHVSLKYPFVLSFHICCIFQLGFSFYIIWLELCMHLQDKPKTCGYPGLVNDLAPMQANNFVRHRTDFFKLFHPRTGLVDVSEGECRNCG
jgi:hypothetical protein